MKIHLLNHASILLEYKDVRLLMDPWFQGTCFDGGWALKYENPQALQLASTATHLWISHFHGDHFHPQTLRMIAECNPKIQCVGSVSYNFRMDEAFARFGFKHIQPMAERTLLRLSDSMEIERYPTTGIDNMLVIRTPDGTIVNFNDCNIPLPTRHKLAKRIGSVAVFLSNFNHAGKLFDWPLHSPRQIKAQQSESFASNFSPFDPRYVIPFASFHQYRAPESYQQNESMLTSEELCPLDDRIVPLAIGQAAEFQEPNFTEVRLSEATERVSLNAITPIQREKSYSFDELQQAASAYCQTLRRGFGGIQWLLPALDMTIYDLQVSARLTARQGLEPTSLATPEIKVHSSALYHWWTKSYGTDNFNVGAHFELVGNPRAIQRWMLAGLLVDNKLNPSALLRMLFHAKGINFLWNRREEIFAILFGRRFVAGVQR